MCVRCTAFGMSGFAGCGHGGHRCTLYLKIEYWTTGSACRMPHMDTAFAPGCGKQQVNNWSLGTQNAIHMRMCTATSVTGSHRGLLCSSKTPLSARIFGEAGMKFATGISFVRWSLIREIFRRPTWASRASGLPGKRSMQCTSHACIFCQGCWHGTKTYVL